MDTLVNWFISSGGTYDSSSMGLTELEGHGRAAMALRDLPEGYVLFTIPRGLTLSMRTSTLPSLMGSQAWRKHNLHEGWAGLILCMMWEEAQGPSSKWSAYLASLPTSFDTPMFWAPEELEELKGTSVVDKIGRDGAEADYRSKVVPALKSRADLFRPEDIPCHYSLPNYHLMGSRILSRSFTVEKWTGESSHQKEGDSFVPTSDAEGAEDAMEVDGASAADAQAIVEEQDEVDEPSYVVDDDDDSDDEEDPSDVAMVPMADMLNARYGSENAKLFYETEDLRMITTKPITKGDQIWNTYGDPPNSDLLRRYGHVDLVPLPGGELGNPADVVEVRGDLAVASVAQRHDRPADSSAERVDWWLEEGGDDVFVFETTHEVPDDLVSFVRLLLMPAPEWEKTKAKSKLPKAKTDETVLAIVADTLVRRLSDYPTTLEDDAKLLATPLPLNKKHAVIVRMGEKRILQRTLDNTNEALKEMRSRQGKKKRKAEDDGHSKGSTKRRAAAAR